MQMQKNIPLKNQKQWAEYGMSTFLGWENLKMYEF